MEDFKITLAAARVNAKMTQQEAADAINVCKSTIIKWESGKTSPNAQKLSDLLKIYGIPISRIFLP